MREINLGTDNISLDNTVWYNAKTGDSFRVRSNYFENNTMMLQTYDGRIINMAQMNDYVQWSGTGNPPSKPINETQTTSTVPPEVQDLIDTTTSSMLPDDYNLIYNHFPADTTSKMDSNDNAVISTPFVQTLPTEDQKMVARVLSKASSPKVECKISWTKFPSRQLEMLCDFMGIDIEDVCNYYIDQLDIKDIRESIKSQIHTYILSHQIPAETEELTKSESKKPIKKK